MFGLAVGGKLAQREIDAELADAEAAEAEEEGAGAGTAKKRRITHKRPAGAVAEKKPVAIKSVPAVKSKKAPVEEKKLILGCGRCRGELFYASCRHVLCFA